MDSCLTSDGGHSGSNLWAGGRRIRGGWRPPGLLNICPQPSWNPWGKKYTILMKFFKLFWNCFEIVFELFHSFFSFIHHSFIHVLIIFSFKFHNTEVISEKVSRMYWQHLEQIWNTQVGLGPRVRPRAPRMPRAEAAAPSGTLGRTPGGVAGRRRGIAAPAGWTPPAAFGSWLHAMGTSRGSVGDCVTSWTWPRPAPRPRLRKAPRPRLR